MNATTPKLPKSFFEPLKVVAAELPNGTKLIDTPLAVIVQEANGPVRVHARWTERVVAALVDVGGRELRSDLDRWAEEHGYPEVY